MAAVKEIKLRKDQIRDVGLHKDKKTRTLLDYSETGTGKSHKIIKLFIELGFKRAICNAKGKILAIKWVDELAKWGLRGLVVSKPEDYEPGYDWYIFSYAAIRSKAAVVMEKLRQEIDMVVLDEAHNVGGKSLQARLLESYLTGCSAKKIMMATATPIGRTAVELPNQLMVGQHTELARQLKRNLKWQKRFVGRREITECVGWANANLTGQLLKPHIVRTTKREAFGDKLPPMIYTDIKIDISERKLKDLVMEKVCKGKDALKELAAMDAIEAFFDKDHSTGEDNPYIMRCVQATLECAGVLKAPEVAEYADGLADSEKVIICAHNYDVLNELMANVKGNKKVVCHGGMRKEDLVRNYKQFTEGDAQVLIASYALSQGIDLICSRRMIICQMHWDPRIGVQMANRIHRHGQTMQCFHENVIAAGEDGLCKIERLMARNHAKKREQVNVAGLRGTI